MRHFIFLIAFLGANHLWSQNFTDGFPFLLPTNDSTTQEYLPNFPAFTITENHRVSSNADGKFYSNGQPIRFWGVNIVASAAFPPKQDAPIIAARMRKMGINLVRFHHLENNWTGLDGCIFDYSQGTRQLQAATLDRLDFFIAELKKNGIFVNMNLNVSREFKEVDGVAGADSIPDFGKGITLFDPWLQDLQKEYAQQLMGHTNPYTNQPLSTDPVLAMVEMNNENSLYGYWKSEALKPLTQGGNLLHRHNVMLDSLWNAWLTQKYTTQSALADVWNVGAQTPGAGNQVLNAGFEADTLENWELEIHDAAIATISKSNNSPYSGNACLQLSVGNYTGTGWHIQLKQPDLGVQKDSVYVLRFAARADEAAQFTFAAMRDNSPYTWYGGNYQQVGTSWGIYTFTFIASEDNLNNVRITLSPGANGNYYFDDFSLGKPTASGTDIGENLAASNIRRINWQERQLYTVGRLSDMSEFYLTTQKNHFNDLRNYLKSQLNIPAPITGTNALGGPHDAMLHDDCDFLDDHAYWDHPKFPSGAWDSYDWNLNNDPLVRDEMFASITSVFSGLQYNNKPYTVSEYNHSSPNRYRTEMPHALLAYSAFQGADGLMFFDYNAVDGDWNYDIVRNFFSLHRDNSIMALFPSCAKAYRDGLIAEGTNATQINYNPNWIYASGKTDFKNRWDKFLPYDRRWGLTQKIETSSYAAAATTDFQALPSPPTSPFTTSSDETSLNTTTGVLTTATDKFVAISGFLDENPNIQAGALTLQAASKFGSLTWISLTADALNVTRRSLLTISTAQQNSEMLWDSTITVHSDWGDAPTVQSPSIVALRLSMVADTLVLWQLDATGAKVAENILLPVLENVFEFIINQNSTNTLWYGIEARGGSTAASNPTPNIALHKNFPSPIATGNHTVQFTLAAPSKVQATLLNIHGQQLAILYSESLQAGQHQFQVAVDDLVAGSYYIRLESQLDGNSKSNVEKMTKKTYSLQVVK